MNTFLSLIEKTPYFIISPTTANFIQNSYFYVLIQTRIIKNQIFNAACLKALHIILNLIQSNRFANFMNESTVLIGQLAIVQMKSCIQYLEVPDNQSASQIKQIQISLHIISNFFLKLFNSQSDFLFKLIFYHDFNILKRDIFNDFFSCTFQIINVVSVRAGGEINSALRAIYENQINVTVEFIKHTIFKLQEQESLVHEDIQAQDIISSGQQFISIKNKWENYQTEYNDNPRAFVKKFLNELYMEEALEEKAAKFAIFLRMGQLIKPEKLIETLGENKTFNLLVLDKYVKLFNISNLPLIQALRVFFSNFLMFGEAQMIERVLDKFSLHYFNSNNFNNNNNNSSVNDQQISSTNNQQNSSIINNQQNCTIAHFETSDAVYTFIYALIMLNTDLYNKTIVEHMTLDQFRNQVKKINNGKNLPDDFIKQCYTNISNDQIQVFQHRDMVYEECVPYDLWVYHQMNREDIERQLNPQLLEPRFDFSKFSNICQNESINNTAHNLYIQEYLTHSINDMICTKVLNHLTNFIDILNRDIQHLTVFFVSLIKVQISRGTAQIQAFIEYLMESMHLQEKITLMPEQKIKINANEWFIQKVLILFQALKLSFMQCPTGENSKSSKQLALSIVCLYKFLGHILKDPVTLECSHASSMIKHSNRFHNKLKYENSSLFSKFASFLQTEEASSEDDDDPFVQSNKHYEFESAMRSYFSIQNNQQDENCINAFVNEDLYLKTFLELTRLCDDTRFVCLMHSILDITTNLIQNMNAVRGQYEALSKEQKEGVVIKAKLLAKTSEIQQQIVYAVFMVFKIVMCNSDRVKLVWDEFSAFLLAAQHPGQDSTSQFEQLSEGYKTLVIFIKQQKNQQFYQNFCKYLLLQLCCVQLHQFHILSDFKNVIETVFTFLHECSIEIIQQLLEQVQIAISYEQMHFEECWEDILNILNKFQQALLSKNLSNDQIIRQCMRLSQAYSSLLIKTTTSLKMELIQEPLNKTINIYANFLRQLSPVLTHQNEIAVQSVQDFVLMLEQTLSQMSTQMPESSNGIIKTVLGFLVFLTASFKTDFPILATLNMTSHFMFYLKYGLFSKLQIVEIYSTLWGLWEYIKAEKAEKAILLYLELICKSYLHYINDIQDSFDETLWFSFLKEMSKVIRFCQDYNLQDSEENLKQKLKSIVILMLAKGILCENVPSQKALSQDDSSLIIEGNSMTSQNNSIKTAESTAIKKPVLENSVIQDEATIQLWKNTKAMLKPYKLEIDQLQQI